MKYSQSNIEDVLDKLFTTPGYFLEIGCWNGEHYSQTAWLERQRGWSGLCVDPFPVNFEERKCLLCNKAISIDGLPREFLKVSIDRRHGGDVSYLSGFADSIFFHYPLIKSYCDYETVMVETVTFEQLIKQYHLPSRIDFLSIDTEGSELEVFKGIDFTRQLFGVITYEHNFDFFKQNSIRYLLSEHGYILHKELEFDEIWISRQHTNNG